jgi:hypothetical protein
VWLATASRTSPESWRAYFGKRLSVAALSPATSVFAWSVPTRQRSRVARSRPVLRRPLLPGRERFRALCVHSRILSLKTSASSQIVCESPRDHRTLSSRCSMLSLGFSEAVAGSTADARTGAPHGGTVDCSGDDEQAEHREQSEEVAAASRGMGGRVAAHGFCLAVHLEWCFRAHSSRTVPRVMPRRACRVVGWTSDR